MPPLTVDGELPRQSVQLLEQTDNGLNSQLRDLRPVLDTLVANSANVRETLQTLASFARFWPESMPGDYLQLDVCQAPPEEYDEGVTCPQSDQNDDPDRAGSDRVGSDGTSSPSGVSGFEAPFENSVELILRMPLRRSS